MSTYKNSTAQRRVIRGVLIVDDGHDWQEFTRKRLLWFYGPERTAHIEAGVDPRTIADLAAWRRLGGRRAA